ncbi:MAG: HU-CCDC81 and SPOR domain-containing protein [Bacteroidetes bacterium]|jgi:hypothetical protein|nr:HU-CCDC81 and SPOR domain-containing protein [Bacteroidota bacterium]MBT3751722.1 HU-CCDC81 and SPOR domain-containing protein [Bacteroidota bacterium]MBT4400698.1 HU-CCDC81 and SPOR domain-containing protein [Bacteroidota bacterium]MBT4408720.1 HU-CCDC81 and SPOR domain-containing protein [Bacteroidota bacterium]MBT7094027.1 HU-CCDC81 and SPOR domain-containing protein [Bacteroidota bacterium]
MDFDKHLRDLLFLEDCVILPDLGAFVSNFKSADIRHETHTFYPPTKEIRFNTELSTDDSLLANFIAGREDLEVEEARELIVREIDDINSRLKSGEQVSLDGIGNFTLSTDGRLSFKALLGTNFYIDSFGFSAFHFPQLEPEKESFLKRSAIFRSSETVSRDSLPGTVIKEKDDSKRSYRWAAIAIPVLVVVSLIPFNGRITDSLFRHPASLGPLPSLIELDPPVGQDVGRYSSNTYFIDIEEQKQVLKPKEEVPKETFVASEKELKVLPFPVIAGSFQSQHNANLLLRKLKAKGYQAETMKSANGYIRVILGRYPSLVKAQQALTDLKSKNPDLSLWILK